jgi:hypothetical protein
VLRIIDFPESKSIAQIRRFIFGTQSAITAVEHECIGGLEKATLYAAGNGQTKNAGWNLDSGLEIKQVHVGAWSLALSCPRAHRSAPPSTSRTDKFGESRK